MVDNFYYRQIIIHLLQFLDLKKGIAAHTTYRLQHWGIILLNYDFQMNYVPSKKLGHADSLSRLILKYCEPLEDTLIATLKDESELKEVLVNTVCELLVTWKK